MKLLFIYLFIINVFAFLLFGLDKLKAKKNKYRIPESTLLLICLLGGSLGSLVSMRIFHHKTKKIKFILVPIFLCIHIILVIYYIKAGL